jgi:histidinol-phosphatase (PHP family)
MLYKTDFHIHSTFSDGKAAPEEYVASALAAGMKEIGFSEHINLGVPGQAWCMDPGRVREYISYIRALAKMNSDIKIKTGLEVDFFSGKEELIHDFLKDLDLDYVIGSVHYLGEKSVDNSPEFYENKDIDEIWGSYFSLVCEAIESGLFDIIGHIDLVRIYNFRPEGDQEKHYIRLAEKLKIHDVAIEINTNGRNRPLGDFYPDRRFLKIFHDQNVPVCVNSDAHFPARVGQYFDEAYKLLEGAGFKEMAVFTKRERFLVPADFRSPDLIL